MLWSVAIRLECVVCKGRVNLADFHKRESYICSSVTDRGSYLSGIYRSVKPTRMFCQC